MGKRGFASAVIGFLLTVRDGHPTTPIVVTSPIFGTWRETLGPSKAIFAPDEGQTVENQNEMLMSLQQTRSQLKGVVEMLQKRGDSNLHYRDGLELLGEVRHNRQAPGRAPPLACGSCAVASLELSARNLRRLFGGILSSVGVRPGGRGVALGGRLAPEPRRLRGDGPALL